MGWPRSGTHWLKAMLESATGQEWAQSHVCQEEADGECVLIVRDPRDAFASHWRLYQHDHPGTQRTELEHLRYFMEGHSTTPHLRGGWVPHTQKLFELSTLYPLVHYEGLYTHPEQTLAWVLAELGTGFPTSHIAVVVQAAQGQRHDPSPFPVDAEMGKPGKWKAQLQTSTIEALVAYCEELIVEIGYFKHGSKAE